MEQRPRAKIVRIGTVSDDGLPGDWILDCEQVEGLAAIEFSPEGILYGGWSVNELRWISEHQN